MKRTFAIILAVLAAAALFGGLVYNRSGGRARFRARRHYGSRPDSPAILGNDDCCARSAWRGHRWAGSGSPRQSFRHRLRPIRSHRGPHGRANRRGQWRAEFGYCQRWSRHRQRSSRSRSGVRDGADRTGPRRACGRPRQGVRSEGISHDHDGADLLPCQEPAPAARDRRTPRAVRA